MKQTNSNSNNLGVHRGREDIAIFALRALPLSSRIFVLRAGGTPMLPVKPAAVRPAAGRPAAARPAAGRPAAGRQTAGRPAAGHPAGWLVLRDCKLRFRKKGFILRDCVLQFRKTARN